MKIQIDTENKIIKVEEAVNFGVLIKFLEKSLPDYKEYKVAPIMELVQNPVFPDQLWPPKVLYFNNPLETGRPYKDPYEITCKAN